LSYAPAKNGSQNVCQLPTNRQQVCDVFSKKKDTRARSPGKGRGKTTQGICFVQLDHAQHPVPVTTFHLIVKRMWNECPPPALKDFQEIWTTGSSGLRSEIDALQWKGPEWMLEQNYFMECCPCQAKATVWCSSFLFILDLISNNNLIRRHHEAQLERKRIIFCNFESIV